MKQKVTILPLILLACSHASATLVPTGGGDAEVRGIFRVEEFGAIDDNGMETSYLNDSGDAEVRFMSTTDSVLWEWGYYDGSYFVPQMTLESDGVLSIEAEVIAPVGRFGITSMKGNGLVEIGFLNDLYGMFTFAIGGFNSVSASSSVVCIVGSQNDIDASACAVVGLYNNVGEFADYSLSVGQYIVNEGCYASAFGYGTTSSSYAGIAIGQYNKAVTKDGNLPNATSWQGSGSDPGPVFEVGVGTSSSNLQNGLTVFQDGSVVLGTDDAISQVLLARAQGDVGMGVFGN